MKRRLAHGTSGRGQIGAVVWSRTATSGDSLLPAGSVGTGARTAAAISAAKGKALAEAGTRAGSATGATGGSAGLGLAARPQLARDTGGSEKALTSDLDKIWYTASLAARGSAKRISAFCGCTFTSTSS